MSKPPHLTPAKMAEHAARESRLAEALRENLRRRKAQARAQQARSRPATTQADSAGEAPLERKDPLQ